MFIHNYIIPFFFLVFNGLCGIALSEDVPDQEFEQSVTIDDIIGNQVHTFIASKEFPKDPKQGFAPANLDNTEMVVTAEPTLKPPFTEVAADSYLDVFDEI